MCRPAPSGRCQFVDTNGTLESDYCPTHHSSTMMTFLPLALLVKCRLDSPGAISKTTANYQERQTLGMDAQPEPGELPANRA